MTTGSANATPKNGSASKADSTQPKVENVQNATAPAEVKIPKPEAPVIKNFTLHEIEQKTEFLNTLFTKRMRLHEAKLKLEKFRIGSDDSLTVRFSDNDGNSFTTANKEPIEKMLRMVKDGISVSLMEVEAHIKSIFE